MLVASGDGHGGYTLCIREGRVRFEHVRIGKRTEISAALPHAIRRCSLLLHVDEDQRATAMLFADCERLDQGRIPLVSTHLSFWGLDVVCDAGIPVSSRYEAPFAFPEAGLDHVTMRFFEAVTAQEIAAALEATE